jgi:hypothetical protein
MVVAIVADEFIYTSILPREDNGARILIHSGRVAKEQIDIAIRHAIVLIVIGINLNLFCIIGAKNL